jgi:hypothetical protein
MQPGWPRQAPLRGRLTRRSEHLSLKLFHVLLVLVSLIYAAPSFAKPKPDHRLGKIKRIISEFQTHLQLRVDIRPNIASVDARLVSVEQIGDPGGGHAYILSFDEMFLASLTSDELRAAIAHELGHVWIFSHHPYLHTEAFANDIAMKVVSRRSLEKTYAKVWAHLGSTGNLEELLATAKAH